MSVSRSRNRSIVGRPTGAPEQWTHEPDAPAMLADSASGNDASRPDVCGDGASQLSAGSSRIPLYRGPDEARRRLTNVPRRSVRRDAACNKAPELDDSTSIRDSSHDLKTEFNDLSAALAATFKAANEYRPRRDELDQLESDSTVATMSGQEAIGVETSAGNGIVPLFSSENDGGAPTGRNRSTGSEPVFRASTELREPSLGNPLSVRPCLKELSPEDADALASSMRWLHPAFELLSEFTSRHCYSTVAEAIRRCAVRITPPIPRIAHDENGSPRLHHDPVLGPLHFDGRDSMIAMGFVEGPSVYDVLSENVDLKGNDIRNYGYLSMSEGDVQDVPSFWDTAVIMPFVTDEMRAVLNSLYRYRHPVTGSIVNGYRSGGSTWNGEPSR